MAGGDTTRDAAVNTLCYLSQCPDAKAKYMAEITPILDAAKDDFMAKLNSDAVDQFEYARCCWYEAMRLMPPAPMPFEGIFVKPVTIKGVQFTPNIPFLIHFVAVHRDPQEWQNPEEFKPERFDPKSPMWRRPDGEPRSPYSFSPFSGGSRICMGKTLAEIMETYITPMMMYHFSFDFINEEHRTNRPWCKLGAPCEPVIPMTCVQTRKLQ